MPRIPQEGLIPRGDRLLVQAFPKLAKRLENNVDELDKADKELLVKLLPGAIERSTIDSAPTNNLHESIEAAISQIVTVVKLTSFGLQPASVVEPAPQVDTSNMSLETGETTEGDSEPEPPKGSDTSQQAEANALPHNGLEAPAGNDGELGSAQEHPQNARVRTGSKLQGRRAVGRVRRATSANVDD